MLFKPYTTLGPQEVLLCRTYNDDDDSSGMFIPQKAKVYI